MCIKLIGYIYFLIIFKVVGCKKVMDCKWYFIIIFFEFEVYGLNGLDKFVEEFKIEKRKMMFWVFDSV